MDQIPALATLADRRQKAPDHDHHRARPDLLPAAHDPRGAGDFQQLQALFKAAVETRHLPSVPRVLGEPVIVISREIWRRVTTTAVAPSSPAASAQTEAAAVDAAWREEASEMERDA